jgi:GST-like protein
MPLQPITQLLANRVAIRPVSGADLDDLFEINGDDAVTRFLPYKTWRTADDAGAWLARMEALGATGTGQQLVIERREDRKVIGTVLLFRFDEGSARLELGYVLGRAHWRQGYAAEALRAVCGHAFKELAVRRIEAEVDPRNTASNALLLSLGFVQEGLLRQRWLTKGVASDTNLFGCLAHEWRDDSQAPAPVTAPLTLFGSKGSGSAAIECALRRCALAYKVVRASTWEEDSARDELASLNPLGQIPTLVLQDRTVVTESAAILAHLGLQFPDSGLLPADASARAMALRGLVFIASNCYSAISIGDYPQRWTSATSPEAHAQVREAARRQLHRHWEIFADTFAATPFLAGAAPGALDYLAAVVTRWSGTRQHLAAARPEFAATLRRIESDPLVAAVFAAHWDA